MGLCMGMSIVTVIEIIWLLIRMVWTILMFKILRNKPTVTKNVAEKKTSKQKSYAWQ